MGVIQFRLWYQNYPKRMKAYILRIRVLLQAKPTFGRFLWPRKFPRDGITDAPNQIADLKKCLGESGAFWRDVTYDDI